MSDDRPWPKAPPSIVRNEDDFAPLLPVSCAPIQRTRQSIKAMTHDEVEDMVKEILGRAPLYDVKRLAGRFRLWALKDRG